MKKKIEATTAYAVVQNNKIITDYGHLEPLMIFLNEEEAKECKASRQKVVKVRIKILSQVS